MQCVPEDGDVSVVHVRVFMYMDDLCWCMWMIIPVIIFTLNFKEHKFYVVFIVLSSVVEMHFDVKEHSIL